MRKLLLYDIKDALERCQLVTSGSDFSTDWLGQTESYMRSLRAKGREPSLGVVAICGIRLQRAAEEMLKSDSHLRLGVRFLAMSRRCHELVNAEAVELDLTDA